MKRKAIAILVGLFLILAFVYFEPGPAASTAVSPEIGKLLGIDGKYDVHSALMSEAELQKLEKILKSLPRLEAEVKFKVLPNNYGYAEGEESKTTTGAAGSYIGDRYILSVAHFVAFQTYSVQTLFGSLFLPIEVKERKTILRIEGKEFELREVKVDIDQDWALFELPKELWGKNSAPKIGKSAELKPGHFIYLMGHPFNNGTLLRNGIVEAESFDLKELGPNIKREDAFALSGGIYPGDSGGLVFALRDGELELVGIMKSTWMYTIIGHALKISPLLDKIKAATGIDLRK